MVDLVWYYRNYLRGGGLKPAGAPPGAPGNPGGNCPPGAPGNPAGGKPPGAPGNPGGAPAIDRHVSSVLSIYAYVKGNCTYHLGGHRIQEEHQGNHRRLAGARLLQHREQVPIESVSVVTMKPFVGFCIQQAPREERRLVLPDARRQVLTAEWSRFHRPSSCPGGRWGLLVAVIRRTGRRSWLRARL